MRKWSRGLGAKRVVKCAKYVEIKKCRFIGLSASFKLTKDTLCDQSWRIVGIAKLENNKVFGLSAAWTQEKQRRRAMLRRKEGAAKEDRGSRKPTSHGVKSLARS